MLPECPKQQKHYDPGADLMDLSNIISQFVVQALVVGDQLRVDGFLPEQPDAETVVGGEGVGGILNLQIDELQSERVACNLGVAPELTVDLLQQEGIVDLVERCAAYILDNAVPGFPIINKSVLYYVFFPVQSVLLQKALYLLRRKHYRTRNPPRNYHLGSLLRPGSELRRPVGPFERRGFVKINQKFPLGHQVVLGVEADEMDLIIVGALMNSFFGVVDDDAVVGDLHSLEGSQDQTHYESNGEQDEEDDYDSFPIFFYPSLGGAGCLHHRIFHLVSIFLDGGQHGCKFEFLIRLYYIIIFNC